MTDKKNKDTVTLSEITFDAWDADNLLVSNPTEPITINTDTPLSSYGTDVITVTLDDLKDVVPGSHGDYTTAPITAGVNGISQGDLFNGWPEDGSPTITIKTNLDDE